MLKASSLVALRAIAEEFAQGPLPEWREVSRTSILTAHDARARMDKEGYVALILRGQAKLITRDEEQEEIVEQFLGRGDLAAAQVRPSWASTTGPPMSISRWYGRKWSVPDMELYSLTSCIVLHIDAALIASLAAKYPGWSRAYSAFLWSYVDIMWAIVQDGRVKSARQRYDELMNRKSPPRAATQAEVASFLGVTRQSLNRLLSASNSPELPHPTRD